ncbi:MAG TPA: 30S ribosomal protein S1 [Trueperaceae bacterium]|nr:30S ribosomal protein S1 [Trueperaceae bacterium]
MDEKVNPAAGNPAPGTVPAPEERPNQAAAADAEQGVGTPVDNEDTTSFTPASSETADSNSPTEVAATAAGHEPGSDDAAPAADASSADVPPAADATSEGAAPTVDASSEEDVPPAPAASSADVPSAPEASSADVAPAPEASSAATATAGEDDVAATAPSADSAPSEASAAPSAADNEMSMEDVLAASDEMLARKPVHRGMITTGQVIMLAQEGIVVDVGAKIEGMLPYNQLFEHESNLEEAAKYFKAGDDIQVYVVRSDIPNSTITLSKKRADQERAWNLLQDIHDNGKPVEVEIVEKVRGGLVASLGVRAFLPASQVDIRRVNDLAPYVGRRMKVKIIELNRRRNRVIISRRAILEDEISHLKEDTLKKLEPGARLEGEVVEITDFGVFVNLGGVDGLVHRSELTHGRFSHPRDVVKLGDMVKVEVLDMDLERERINLSMKKLVSNPWENVLAHYNIGQRVTGTVTNLTPFGAFVEIEPGLEGLIHVSEMSWTKRIRHPKEALTEGEEVEAMILKIDIQQQRISLGLRQTQPDPWSSLPDRYPPGTEITGPITGITDFGVFMEIEEGIEGLVHISELSHDHIENINEHFKKGDEITAVILNIDPVEQRASLSRKRMLPFTPENAAEFGGNQPAGGPSRGAYAQPAGAGASRGRRGRRSRDIDYDYSYVADAAGSKTTTKLGDVYADLFAQFGLGDTKADAEAEAEGGEAKEAVADAETTEKADEPAPVAESAAAPVAEPAPAPAAKPAPAPVAKAEPEEHVDPENAIDATEAAAMLTAAFRQGKRPSAAEAEATADAEAQAGSDAAHDEAETGAASEATAQEEAEDAYDHATEADFGSDDEDQHG